ncbi:MAG: PAS domain S-box protein [Acidobacteriota bacterium]
MSLVRLVDELERLLRELRARPADRVGPETVAALERELRGAQAELNRDLLERYLRCTVESARTEEALRRQEGQILESLREIAGQKRGELERERFRALLDQAAESIFLIHPGTGRILDFSRAACSQLGYSREELSGLGIQEIQTSLPLPSSESWRAWVEKTKAADKVLIEGWHRCKDGSSFPVEVSASLRTFEHQDYLVLVARDVAHRKRAEKRLRRQWGFFSRLAEYSRDGIIAFDRQCRFTFCNPAGERILGVSRSAVLGKNVFEALPRLKELGEDGLFMASLAGKTVASRNRRWVEGTVFDGHYSPLLADSREIVGGIGIIRDVTDRHRLEGALSEAREELHARLKEQAIAQEAGERQLLQEVEELRQAKAWLSESEQQLRLVIENLHQDVLTVGWDGRIIHLYHRKAGLVAKTDEDAYRCLLPASREVLRKALQRVFQSGTTEVCEVSSLEQRWYEARLVPLRQDGAVDSVMIFAGEITGGMRLRGKKDRLLAGAPRGGQTERLGLVAGAIARNYEELWSDVLSHAGLILAELPEESSVRHFVEEIEAEALRAMEWTRQLLLYAGSSGRQEKAVDLCRVVNEIEHSLARVISPRALLEIQCAEETPLITADEDQIRELIMSLVVHASDSLGEKRGTVRVSAGAIEADEVYLSQAFLDEELPAGRYVYLEVSSTGPALDAEALGKMFLPFVNTKSAGSGIGLATVLGVVRGHRGAITVDSDPEQGTSFRVLFPVRKLSVDPGGSILVVDDEETVRAVVRVTLEEFHGFKVLTARDCHEAVSVYRRHSEEIVAVLMEPVAAELDGEGALSAIRRIDPEARVIVMSAEPEEDLRARFAGKGLSGFLHKPFQTAELVEKLREALPS